MDKNRFNISSVFTSGSLRFNDDAMRLNSLIHLKKKKNGDASVQIFAFVNIPASRLFARVLYSIHPETALTFGHFFLTIRRLHYAALADLSHGFEYMRKHTQD